MTDWRSASVSQGVKKKKRNWLEEDISAPDPHNSQARQKLAQPLLCGAWLASCAVMELGTLGKASLHLEK